MALEARHTIEIAVAVRERRGVHERGCGDPVVVLTESLADLRELSFECSGAVSDCFVQREFAQLPDQESDGLLVRLACGELSDADGRTSQRITPLATEESAYRTHDVRVELTLELDQE